MFVRFIEWFCNLIQSSQMEMSAWYKDWPGSQLLAGVNRSVLSGLISGSYHRKKIVWSWESIWMMRELSGDNILMLLGYSILFISLQVYMKHEVLLLHIKEVVQPRLSIFGQIWIRFDFVFWGKLNNLTHWAWWRVHWQNFALFWKHSSSFTLIMLQHFAFYIS